MLKTLSNWKFRNLIVGAVALATVFGLKPAEAQQTLKIGGIGTLTGAGSGWGLAIQRGTQLAIDEVIRKGGLKAGGITYKPELIMYDDAYTGQGGKTAMERLLYQDKVSFVMGPIGSPPVLGAVAALDDARTNQNTTAVLLNDGASLEILKNRFGAPFNFLICNTNREYAPAAVKWYKENTPGLKKVAVLAPNDAVGQTVAPVLIQAYKDIGVDVWFEMFDRGTKEFTPLMTRMVSAGVDALDLDNNAPGDAGLLYRQARQAGFRGKIWQTGGPAVEEIMGVVGRLSEGFLSYDLYDFKSDKAKPLVEAYEKRYGKGIINAFTPIMYNGAKMLFAAIEKSASIDPKAVRDTIEGMNGYDLGVFGPIKWAGKSIYGVDHQLKLPFLIVEIKDGKIVTRAVVEP